MPLYHLSLIQGKDTIQDDDAINVKNDDAAWEEARTAFGELIIDLDREQLAGSEWRMEVKRESGEVVFRLRFSAEAL